MKITELIAGSKMSRFQIVAIVVAIVLTVLEGYDDAVMVFIAPYVTKEFASSASMIGVVLSGSLIGMVVGSVVVAPIADKVGRKLIAVIGTVVVAIGMVLSPLSTSMQTLLGARIVTGLGLGALVSVIGVIAAEYSNRRVYPIVMAIYAAGINIGAVLGAVLIGPLLPSEGWRFGFWVGVVLSVIAFVLAVTLFPESVSWLAARRKPGSLDRLNKTLARMGHDPLPQVPASEMPKHEGGHALRTVFSKQLAAQTILMIVGYIAFLVVFYFANNWAPNSLAAATHNEAIAAPTTLALGSGGIVGAVVFGIITSRVNARIMTPIFLIVGFAGLAIFGSIETRLPASLFELFVTSFFFSAGVAGFYQIVPQLYPTLARATGYGIVVGAGRIGGIASPILAGAAFDSGMSVATAFVVFALPLVVSALTIIALALVERAQQRRGVVSPATEVNNLTSSVAS